MATTVMNRSACIFVGYRRSDSQGFAGRVADDLIDCFGTVQVFRDDDIPEGSDFTKVLESALSNSSVLIVVIGPNWLNAVNSNGQRRLDDPEDWVRREIEVALERNIWLLPILVGDAAMPAMGELPEPLSPVASVQAFEMSDRGWDEDLKRLAALLCRRLPALDLKADSSNRLGPMPVLRNMIERVMDNAKLPTRNRRSPANPVGRRLSALLVRIAWMLVLTLVAWYVLENHATPEFRNAVFGFLVFAREKYGALTVWLAQLIGTT